MRTQGEEIKGSKWRRIRRRWERKQEKKQEDYIKMKETKETRRWNKKKQRKVTRRGEETEKERRQGKEIKLNKRKEGRRGDKKKQGEGIKGSNEREQGDDRKSVRRNHVNTHTHTHTHSSLLARLLRFCRIGARRSGGVTTAGAAPTGGVSSETFTLKTGSWILVFLLLWRSGASRCWQRQQRNANDIKSAPRH